MLVQTYSRIRLAALIAILPVLAASTAFGREILSGNWSGGPYYDQQSGSFTHCAVSSAYRSGDYLVFSLNREGQFGIGIHNPSWNLQNTDVYPVTIIVDRYSPIYGEARPVGTQLATVFFQDAYELFKNVRKGHTLWVESSSARFTFDLMGTSRALQKVAECLTNELNEEQLVSNKSRNPFLGNNPRPVGTQAAGRSERRLDKAELLILASNALAEAGVSGHRFLADNERSGLFEGMDVAWIGPGMSAGGLVGVQIGRPAEIESSMKSAAQTIAAADAKACAGQYGSLPGTVSVSESVTHLKIQTACASSDGKWTANYSMFGTSDGRLFTFSVVQLGDTSQSDQATEANSGLAYASFDAAAAKVLAPVR